MSIKTVSDFVRTVIQHFPPYRWDEEQEAAWVETIVRELGGFSEKVLERAINDMVRTRKDRKIPLVSECLQACIEARRWIEADTAQTQVPTLRQGAGDDWSSERVKLAYDLLKSPLGRQAAKDSPCWVSALWSFCRKNQRLPKDQEIDRCKRDAQEFDWTYQRLVRGDSGADGFQKVDAAVGRALIRLGSDMLAKRAAMADEVLGGSPIN